jgi:hypothetical protein
VKRRKPTQMADDPGGVLTARELLETSPFKDDLTEELAARPPRAKLPAATLCLGAGVLLVAGFIGGVEAHKQWGGNGSGSGNLQAAIAARGGAGQGRGATGQGAQRGFGAAQGGAGNVTFGTVKLIDGQTIYVQTATGGIVQVKTDKSTAVRISKDGSVRDLQPGQTIVVQGTPGANGTMTATSVNEGGTPAGGGGFRGGAQPGG